MPTLTWTNEIMPIKQGEPVVITLFGGFGYMVLLFVGFMLLPGWMQKILGNYIAARRKELGMTQANLAEKIHVTDKAVSRWERGVGLPDIENLEALAKALEVSLVSLMQGKTCDEKHISIQDAEELVINTIKISKETSKLQKGFWGSILGIFGIIIVLLCILLLRDGKIVMYSVASIVTGLIAWGIPIVDRVFLKTHYVRRTMLVSVGFAFLSVWIQFLDIKNLA